MPIEAHGNDAEQRKREERERLEHERREKERLKRHAPHDRVPGKKDRDRDTEDGGAEVNDD